MNDFKFNIICQFYGMHRSFITFLYQTPDMFFSLNYSPSTISTAYIYTDVHRCEAVQQNMVSLPGNTLLQETDSFSPSSHLTVNNFSAWLMCPAPLHSCQTVDWLDLGQVLQRPPQQLCVPECSSCLVQKTAFHSRPPQCLLLMIFMMLCLLGSMFSIQ